MKKSLAKSLTLAAGILLSATGMQASAASLSTHCYYNLIQGAPWAPQTKLVVYSGHIQCPKYAHEAIGGYIFSRQYHR